MQQLDLASVSIVIASITVVMGVVLAVLQLRDQKKTRQAQLFMEIYVRFERSEFLDTYFLVGDAFGNHQDESHPEFWVNNKGKIGSVLSFYESIGVLVKRKLIDINLVADLISGSTIRLWESIERWVKWRRKNENWPQLWEWMEYLYHEIRKIPSRVATS
jgi:hypothetical protein